MPCRHRVSHTTPAKSAGMSSRTCSQSAMRAATQLQSSHAPSARDPHRRPGGRDHWDGLAAPRAGAETKQKTAQGTLIPLLALSLPSAPVLEPQGGKTPAGGRPTRGCFSCWRSPSRPAPALLELEWDPAWTRGGAGYLAPARFTPQAPGDQPNTPRTRLRSSPGRALCNDVIEDGGTQVTAIWKAFTRAAERDGLAPTYPLLKRAKRSSRPT